VRTRAFAFFFVAGMVHGAGVMASCVASAPGFSFGLYDTLSGLPATAAITVSVTCNLTPPPTVTLSISASAVSGGFFPRRMRQDGGADLLAYNLFADPGGISVLGDGSAGTAMLSERVMRNKPWTATIYGRIPPAQDVAAGSYSDTLTLTINF
jgi:spore coat protein U-like protein